MNSSLQQRTEAYDEHFVLDNRLMLEWYPARVAALASGASMLELGLGHGYTTRYFGRHFAPYRVIDGSADMIARFRERFDLPHVDIVESWFETYETDDRFDSIAMGFVLEHVDDPALVLRHYQRFLKPGGAVFVAVPNSEALHRRIGQAAGLLPDLESLSAVDREFGHQRYFNLRSLTALCTDQGYRVSKAEGILLKPVTTAQMLRLEFPEPILQGLLKVGVDYPELCNAILLKLESN
jgi:ubiquinone/menaquinone biosynthesis C-methylase UbiE